ncbi:uncharacterized protein BJ171DRAFT_516723 [Polychytrium aggregatum]|uniref:uncharacterized protein n=1 Tax=Polychytrium aggregatum TaxID=110093 RepID=UPI0022FE2395|nr:uncharacterized protein BJ171DRAFT_516723 [Polychytrium aggregatum]KAI9201852.1 hypothetical protein BJ171DRAFT_516723 [Polychytrium aggregatum]
MTSDLEGFEAWILPHISRVINLTCRPCHSGDDGADHVDKGAGIFAPKSSLSSLPLGPNNRLVNVPSQLLLNASKVHKIANFDSPLAAAFLQCLESIRLAPEAGLDERKTLMVFLLWIKFKVAKHAAGLVPPDPSNPSFWVPYVRILPERLYTPVMFEHSSREMQLLTGTGLDGAVAAKLAKLHREFQVLQPHLRVLFGKSAATDSDQDDSDDDLTFDAYCWADGIFWSRVISFRSFDAMAGTATAPPGTDDCHLVPFIDLCNHSFEPKLRWNIEKDRSISLVTYDAAADEAGSSAVIPIYSEEELHISYGQKPNSELLFIHGFAIDGNPHDSVAFPAPILEATSEEPGDDDPSTEAAKHKQALIAFKRQALRALGLQSNVTVCTAFPKQNNGELHGVLNDESLMTLWICLMTEDDGLRLEPIRGSDAVTIAIGAHQVADKHQLLTAIHALPHFDVIQLRVWTVLLEMISFRLYELHRSDEELGGWNEPASGSEAMVGILRHGHRQLLMEAMDLLTALQEEYCERPVVVEYLQTLQAEEPDEPDELELGLDEPEAPAAL